MCLCLSGSNFLRIFLLLYVQFCVICERQAKAFSLPYIDIVLRIFRDLSYRDPVWASVSIWVLEKFVCFYKQIN